jgi:hypothetical protein
LVAEKLLEADANADDPNTALKAWWPSVDAYRRFVEVETKIPPPHHERGEVDQRPRDQNHTIHHVRTLAAGPAAETLHSYGEEKEYKLHVSFRIELRAAVFGLDRANKAWPPGI